MGAASISHDVCKEDAETVDEAPVEESEIKGEILAIARAQAASILDEEIKFQEIYKSGARITYTPESERGPRLAAARKALETENFDLDVFAKNADYYENALYAKALGYHLARETTFVLLNDLGWMEPLIYFSQPMHEDLLSFYEGDPLSYFYAEQKVLNDIRENAPDFSIQLDLAIYRFRRYSSCYTAFSSIGSLPEFWQNKMADIVSAYLESRGDFSAGDRDEGIEKSSPPPNYLCLYIKGNIYVKEKKPISYDNSSVSDSQKWMRYVISELEKNGLFFNKMKKTEQQKWLGRSKKELTQGLRQVRREHEAAQTWLTQRFARVRREHEARMEHEAEKTEKEVKKTVRRQQYAYR